MRPGCVLHPARHVVTGITKDHRELEEMIGKVTSGNGEDRRGAFDRLCTALPAHEHAEEQKVYPELSTRSSTRRS